MPRAASARQRSSSRFLARVLPGAKPAPFPDFIEPCLATLRSKVPNARGFVHELKLDGYRVQAVMGASNFTYVEATWTQALADWIGAHTRAFAAIDGVRAWIELDINGWRLNCP